MFDKDIIEDLPREIRVNVKMALVILHNSPIFELQEQRLLATLLAGSETEDEGMLQERILKFRIDKSRLLKLRQLGEDFNEEDDNDR